MGDYEVGDGPVEWVGDPLRDTLTYRWIDNARAALELIFLDDAVSERYEDWVVRHEGSPAAADDANPGEGDSMVLEQWTSETGDAVILSAGPRRNDFVLDVLSPGFEASIGVLFDVSTHDLIAGTLNNFSGDPEAGLVGGAEFGEMILDEEAELLTSGMNGTAEDDHD